MPPNYFGVAKSHLVPVLVQSHPSQPEDGSGSSTPAAADPDAFANLTLQSRDLVPESRDHGESRKCIIRYFYLELNLPLREVMKIMRDKYHFRATIRMYKRQFRNWKWVKYSPRSVLTQQGLEQGQVHGDPLDADDSQAQPQSHPNKSRNSALFSRKGVNALSKGTFSDGPRLNKVPLDDESTRLNTVSFWNTQLLLDHCFGDQARHLTDAAHHPAIIENLQSGFRLLSVPGNDSGSQLDYEIGRMLLS
ncbi:hypothetical protein B0T19DRAFT_1024 [Cercophora scortea]|uniref:Clr5 domain-containing protein n=1 Tax=Cercophora scortea TaxID=314031 RepID=A0AAE0J257_9PEZI|nr:hypothetical protein B0T19DRAFT_1024 [Cercophora scortea]